MRGATLQLLPIVMASDTMMVPSTLIPSVILYALESPTLMFQRGFFCNDESIKYPYKEDTVSVGVLVAVGLLVPTVTMVLCEWFIYRYFVRCSEEGSPWRPYNRKKLCCCSVHPWANALYSTIGPFGLGAAFTLLLTDSGKYVIGRLRPHFISVCQPDWSLINCTDSDGYYQYVQDIPCLGTDNHQLTDGR
nr:phospholipid phosphatase 1-like [Lytechinus pictus]